MKFQLWIVSLMGTIIESMRHTKYCTEEVKRGKMRVLKRRRVWSTMTEGECRKRAQVKWVVARQRGRTRCHTPSKSTQTRRPTAVVELNPMSTSSWSFGLHSRLFSFQIYSHNAFNRSTQFGRLSVVVSGLTFAVFSRRSSGVTFCSTGKKGNSLTCRLLST